MNITNTHSMGLDEMINLLTESGIDNIDMVDMIDELDISDNMKLTKYKEVYQPI